MALPTLSSRSWPAMQNINMYMLHQRRCRDEEKMQNNLDTSRFFQKSKMKAERVQKWTSDSYYQKSIDDQKEKLKKEADKKNLMLRQTKLSEMLLRENIQYQHELNELRPQSAQKSLTEMKQRVECLHSARESKRKQLAEEKLLEHWQLNNPEIQQVDRELLTDHVVSEWSNQVEHAKKQAEEEAKEEEEYRLQLKAAEEEAMETARREEEKRMEQQRSLQEILRQQMEELKRKEAEAATLREQQAAVELEKSQMEALEEERRKIEEKRKKQDFGLGLLRQHKLQMQRQARRVQQELEEDMKLLSVLAEREKETEQIETARKEAAQNDARWMREVLEEQMKVEKLREAELDFLFEEEAARMWKKREREWELEKQAREKLMLEVLKVRQQQMSEKLERLSELQAESLQDRENLLKDMEIAQQLSHRERERLESAQSTQRKTLDDQMQMQREGLQSARQMEKLQLQEEEDAAEEQQAALREETERRRLQGYVPRSYGRRTAWM
ncbi:trichoplein keratin filament-binding protein-like [Argonauta hians]